MAESVTGRCFARVSSMVMAIGAISAPQSGAQALVNRAAAGQRAASGSLAGSNIVTVTAHDFAFDMPASMPAGLTTFRLLNRGKQEHHLSIVKVDQGKTVADAMAAIIAAGHGLRPVWLHAVGGPNAIAPGAEARATLTLTPGTYLAFCEVPGPDPAPHYMKGMMKGFTVTQASPPPSQTASLPRADLNITLSDYAFTFSHELTHGRHVIAVTNAATQPHMMVITRFHAGKGMKDFLAWAFNPGGKAAPGDALGGVTEIASGVSVVIDGDFPPGHYGIVCFSPDSKDSKPHFMHGMQKEFTVE